ncbi:hypothetical protein B0T11DRAFT_7369 [Plectosphaerella cucumerina]|uniref:DUF202 domain-containing protein n=1 Tax=Plectosphaerella cucumerina TaxID=40658 RepID=A0A8K0X7U5_9PEZI|nr:hypothetical protein B0T11DRAFT_7369 [Plectosphaerella cucumerina]
MQQQGQAIELSELRGGTSIRSTDAPSTRSGSVASARPAPSISPPWSLKRFWANNITCVVDFDKCRDHLAVERTFLAYLRTALMSAIVGTLVAQLFVLEEGDSGFGYLAVGRPLASLCLVFSICTVVLGAFRAWRHQDAMIRGKALSGGFEIVSLGIICLVMVCVFFGLLIALDVLKRGDNAH